MKGKEQIEFFWKTADFGYVKKKKDELKMICTPTTSTSSLECSKHARYCKGSNIYINLSAIDFTENTNRFKENLFEKGDIGGNCGLDSEALKALSNHKSPLQSWYAELENFTQLHTDPFEEGGCDVILDKPTILMKLDSGLNMYHHFCDFINIYISQHINSSFSQDVLLLMWDTTSLIYPDFFSLIWKVFSHHRVIRLSDFKNKKLCIKDALFSLPPRMRYGFFYNMPLIPGCGSSSLFEAFHHHLIHRLSMRQYGPLVNGKARVTLLLRSTKYRRILNIDQVVEAMRNRDDIQLNVVDFNREMPLEKQINTSYNTDILVGIHGAGLTHLLMLPEWGRVYELHHCGDADCYRDLARLRGVGFHRCDDGTAVRAQDPNAHPMLTNYHLDIPQLLLTLSTVISNLKADQKFISALRSRINTVEPIKNSHHSHPGPPPSIPFHTEL